MYYYAAIILLCSIPYVATFVSLPQKPPPLPPHTHTHSHTHSTYPSICVVGYNVAACNVDVPYPTCTHYVLCMPFTHSGAQPILYPAETLAAAYHTGRPVHTSQLSSSRLGSYSTVPSGYAGLAAPSGTLSGAAATTAGTLQPLSHVPSAQSSQFHYIANTGVPHPHGHSVASPGSHSFSSRSGYSQAMNLQYVPQPGTLQLQPSVTVTPSYNVGYNPVISTSAPAYTQPPQQLTTIHPVTGTIQQSLPTGSFSPPDTITSHSSHLPPHGQVATQPQPTRAHWNAPGY